MYSVREMKMFLLHPRPLLFYGGKTGRIVSKFTWCLGDESIVGNYPSEMHINILRMEG